MTTFGNVQLILRFFSTIVILTAFPTLSFSANQDTDPLKAAEQAADRQQYHQASDILVKHLEKNPVDIQAKFLLARVYSWQKKFDQALLLYAELIELHPQNSDYLLGYASTMYWTQQPKKSLQLLRQARSITPDYQEIWKLELKILAEQDDETSRRTFRQVLSEADSRFPDAQWLSSFRDDTANDIENDTLHTDLELGGRYDDLSDNLPSWHSYFIHLTHQQSKASTFYGYLESADRYDTNDQEFMLGNHYIITADWFINAEVTTGSEHRFFPRWSAHVNIGRKLPDGWNIQAGARTRKHEQSTADTATVKIERYWSDFSAFFSPIINRLDSDSSDNESVTGNRIGITYFGFIHSFSLSFADGKEVEYDSGTDTQIISRVKTINAGGKYWLVQDKWAINYLLEYSEQGTFFNRYGFHLAIRYRI